MQERGKTIVIYHGGCWDGFCAAWVMRGLYPTATFIPAQYGDDPPPDVRDCSVVIVDFSYPRDVLQQIADEAYSLCVLDHHKTAEQALEGFTGDRVYVKFDMTKSGARLAHEYISDPGTTPSWLVTYTEDRDLWRHALPNTREINAALRSYPLSFELWDELATRGPKSFVTEGDAILREQQKIVAEHVRHAEEVHLSGHVGLAVNATVHQSEIAGALAKTALADGGTFGACWFHIVQGGTAKRMWSLRSVEGGADVSAIAKARGGGGHMRAAGFTAPVVQFGEVQL